MDSASSHPEGCCPYLRPLEPGWSMCTPAAQAASTGFTCLLSPPHTSPAQRTTAPPTSLSSFLLNTTNQRSVQNIRPRVPGHLAHRGSPLRLEKACVHCQDLKCVFFQTQTSKYLTSLNFQVQFPQASDSQGVSKIILIIKNILAERKSM